MPAHYERAVDGFLPEKRGGRVVAVTALERRAGRSTTCLGLAQACILEGRPEVVDCHFERPHLHLMLEEPNFVRLSTGPHRQAPPQEYGCEISPGLFATPAETRIEDGKGAGRARAFGPAVRALHGSYPPVLLDAPLADSLRHRETLHVSSDGALIAARHHRSSQRELTDAVQAPGESGIEMPGITFNRCPAGLEEG